MAEGEGHRLSPSSMATPSSSSTSFVQKQLALSPHSGSHFFVWREFLWGALAGGFGEGMMHPIDTVKTRIQSQAILCGSQNQKTVLQMIRTVWAADGLRGFYRGVAPGVTGSLATGATYFGFIESTKKWIEESHPSLSGHWSHFLAGGMGFLICALEEQRKGEVPKEVKVDGRNIVGYGDVDCFFAEAEEGRLSGLVREGGERGEGWGGLDRELRAHGYMLIAKKTTATKGQPGAQWRPRDTLGSFVYVPCEVMKQRMQVQGSSDSWSSVISKAHSGKIPEVQMYGYYNGMFHAGSSILKEQGPKGLYAGYWSTLARDVPFAGLMVMFYEALKDLTDYGIKKWSPTPNYQLNNTVEGLLLGGVAGGLSAYVTTPLDVIKTRLQVQGPDLNKTQGILLYEGISILEDTVAEVKLQTRPQAGTVKTSEYKGWFHAIHRMWMIEGPKGMFRGSVPRVIWYVPASALTFMAVEFLRERFNGVVENEHEEVASISIDSKGSLPEVA
ncbi:hypothetical protein KSS87_018704 [Heliosperma pusillum]|nr:hypothetical protein KSS87_018704 [Heliosperma pusillum]